MALLIIFVWGIGYYAMEMLPINDTSKGPLIGLHKSLGILILVLLIARVTWRIYDSVPPISSANQFIIAASKTVHYLLYLNIFVQVMSGWAMSSAAGYYPSFFGLFTLPGLIPKDKSIVPELVGLHNSSAIVLLLLIVLHISGVVFHHFILRDNTLRKMTVD